MISYGSNMGEPMDGTAASRMQRRATVVLLILVASAACIATVGFTPETGQPDVLEVKQRVIKCKRVVVPCCLCFHELCTSCVLLCTTLVTVLHDSLDVSPCHGRWF